MYPYKTISAYHNALALGLTTCAEAVEHYLNNIHSATQLNAFVKIYAEEARVRAAELDEQRERSGLHGKLHGVVVGIKDVIAYKDHPLTAASKMLEGYASIYNSTAVERLLNEGAIIIGHLNCDEFAMGSSNENSVYGLVRNAADQTRVPGGSSGGSAVAVQAGLCMVSLGSDTGGSVRQPADFCGVIGLKPTYGRVSRYGLIAYASSFDQIGIFSNSVEDAAKTLEVIAGADDFDSTVSQQPVPSYASALDTAPKKYRIAYFSEALSHSGLDPEIAKTFRQFTKDLSADGHTVEPISFQYLDYIVPTYYILTTAEASSNLSRFDGVKFGFRAPEKASELDKFYKKTRSKGFGTEVKRRILLGSFVLSAGYYDAYFTKAQQVRKLLLDHTDLIFKDFDFILLPTSPTTAFRIGEKAEDPIAMYLADIYTVYANLTGIPGISLPMFRHTNGMPFGVQAMTYRFNELSLLRLSRDVLQQYKSYENPTR